jgi:hypothetical protein
MRSKKYSSKLNRLSPTAASLPAAVGTEYLSGQTIFQIAVKYRVSPYSVSERLRSLKVKIRPPGWRPGRKGRGKLNASQIEYILEQDSKNASHTDIAHSVGVSRERVRQICLEASHVSRQSRMTKVLQLREASLARKAGRHSALLELSRLYRQGASFVEISAFWLEGTPSRGRGASLISGFRKRYPKLFPHRNSNR